MHKDLIIEATGNFIICGLGIITIYGTYRLIKYLIWGHGIYLTDVEAHELWLKIKVNLPQVSVEYCRKFIPSIHSLKTAEDIDKVHLLLNRKKELLFDSIPVIHKETFKKLIVHLKEHGFDYTNGYPKGNTNFWELAIKFIAETHPAFSEEVLQQMLFFVNLWLIQSNF